MHKRFSKILIIIFVVVFVLQLVSLVYLVFVPSIASAETNYQFKPQVKIPGLDYETVQPDGSTKAIGNYVIAIYRYAIGIVGILAAVVMMLGGVLWLIAGGNAERVSNAKSWIVAAITGLVLALSSYMILALVNPDLVNFKVSQIGDVKNIEKPVCCWEVKRTDGGGLCAPVSKIENGKLTYVCPNVCAKCAGDQTCKLGAGDSYSCGKGANLGESCTDDSECICDYGTTPQCSFNSAGTEEVCYCT